MNKLRSFSIIKKLTKKLELLQPFYRREKKKIFISPNIVSYSFMKVNNKNLSAVPRLDQSSYQKNKYTKKFFFKKI